MTRVAIVGFGLIGGSLALALRAAKFASHVTAVDRPDVLALARERRAADECVDAADREQVARALAGADLGVLAGPVALITNTVEWALEQGAVITDCGSTKRRIVERALQSARAARFVPGHPMAGLPEGGLARARADLFEHRNWLLCPATAAPDALALVERAVRVTGARVVHLDAAEHDAAVARTSHLPQLLASALRLLADRHVHSGAAGPAFERLTHTAGGPAPIWRDIFASNTDQIALAIRELCAELEPIAAEFSADQTARAEDLLERARRTRS
jgi:prephenate dehydrogenase